jgi:hypothetical protein
MYLTVGLPKDETAVSVLLSSQLKHSLSPISWTALKLLLLIPTTPPSQTTSQHNKPALLLFLNHKQKHGLFLLWYVYSVPIILNLFLCTLLIVLGVAVYNG